MVRSSNDIEIILDKFSKRAIILILFLAAFEYPTSQDFFSLVVTRIGWRVLVNASASVPPIEVQYDVGPGMGIS